MPMNIISCHLFFGFLGGGKEGYHCWSYWYGGGDTVVYTATKALFSKSGVENKVEYVIKLKCFHISLQIAFKNKYIWLFIFLNMLQFSPAVHREGSYHGYMTPFYGYIRVLFHFNLLIDNHFVSTVRVYCNFNQLMLYFFLLCYKDKRASCTRLYIAIAFQWISLFCIVHT